MKSIGRRARDASRLDCLRDCADLALGIRDSRGLAAGAVHFLSAGRQLCCSNRDPFPSVLVRLTGRVSDQ